MSASSSKPSASPSDSKPDAAPSFDAASAERFAESLVPEWEAALHSVEVALAPEEPQEPAAAQESSPDEPKGSPASEPAPDEPKGSPAAAMPASAGRAEDDDLAVPGLQPRSGGGRAKLWVGLALGALALGAVAFASLGGEEGPAERLAEADAPHVSSGEHAEDAAGGVAARGASEAEPEEEGGGDEALVEPGRAQEGDGVPKSPGGAEESVASSEDDESPGSSAEPVAVRITVVATPGDAALFLDGERVDNPLRIERPVGSGPHRLEARADGYVTARRTLRFDAPQEIRIDLRRQRAARKASRRRATRAVSTRRSRGSEAAARRGPRGHGRGRGGSGGRRVRRIITESPY